MNIYQIIEEMNSSGMITTGEYNFWVENYDAGMHPPMDPLSDYTVYDENERFPNRISRPYEDINFYPEMLVPEGDGDDYSPTDDGSWMGR